MRHACFACQIRDCCIDQEIISDIRTDMNRQRCFDDVSKAVVSMVRAQVRVPRVCAHECACACACAGVGGG